MAGSLQYWHRRRAQRRLPRVRNVPNAEKDPISLSNIVAFKAGMTSLSYIDDSESPSKGMEVLRGCTILEVPKTEAYGIRFYSVDPTTKYLKCTAEIYNKAIANKIGIKEIKTDESKISKFKERLSDFKRIGVLLVAHADTIGAEQNHPTRYETTVTGGNAEQRFDFAAQLVGKEVKPADVFKGGEFVDVVSVTKGKGWAGVIKRHGVRRLDHKATQKIRHIGALGAFTPGKIMYTVPRPGQLGFNYRTEHNKRILALGTPSDSEKVNIKSGIKNYGLVKSDYILIEGSVPGPSKRIVRLKKSVNNRNAAGIKEPKVNYIKAV